jgi:hypothetical protein
MNKKILKLGILLVFIFSCTLSTTNNNVEVKPTTSVSSTTSVLPTITPSVQITTIPTITTNQSPSISPTIENTPSPISTYLSYDFSKIYYEDTFTLNKERDGIDNGYNGKVLIIIDTYLLKEYIKSEEELNRMKRKVMILKDSYDELNTDEKEQLKQEYGDYTIFDPNIYKPIKENDMERYSFAEGELSGRVIGFKFNYSTAIYVYRGIYFYKKYDSDLIENPSSRLGNPFSNNLKDVYKNIKISNKKKLMKSPIQKMSFCSISALSYYSDAMFYSVNFFDYLERITFEYFPNGLSKGSRIWGVFQS